MRYLIVIFLSLFLAGSAYAQNVKAQEEKIARLDAIEPADEESDEYDDWADQHEDLEDLLDEVEDRLDELQE